MPHRRSRAQRQRRAHIAQLHASGPITLATTPLAAGDVAALQQALIGTVVTPSSPDYDTRRQLSDPAFQAFPALIAYCEVFEDVWRCLAFARRHGLHLLCRSGGHSTAGFSMENGAMILDTSRLSYVVVDAAKRVARVGAGTSLGVLNAMLDGYRLHVPGGACPDVCVAGHMMGGGYGWTSREFGMNCDNVLEVLVMLADGRTVRANDHVNSDLYWAVRGGTGNNFGVLLEITYQLHDLWKVWGFGFSYPMGQAADALVALQTDYMLDAAPKTFGYQVAWITHGGEKRLVVRGMYHGDADAGRRLVAPLLKLPGATNEIDTVDRYAVLNEGLVDKPYTYPDVPDIAIEDKISGYCARPLDRAEWKGLTDAAQRDPLGWAFANLEVYGGAINARPADWNAFVHRDVYFDWVQDVFWVTDEQRGVAEQFLRDMIAAWTPYLNGRANQDYPRRSETDYRTLFWGGGGGATFDRLLAVKRKYDPENSFHFAQSISPVKGDGHVAASPGEIVEEPYSRRFEG